ncbi:hypothetical protein [Nocardiopsis alba]|uniref:hypothetical protein n=1 Tax=Nocardiopsis alba TaxID=53437 RepID=UPI0033BAEB34
MRPIDHDRPHHPPLTDHILPLHNGHPTETGTHHRLLICDGAHTRLHALQSTRTHLH